jgi:hypothetical protein
MLKSKLPFGLLQECVYKNLPFSRPWGNPNPDLGERGEEVSRMLHSKIALMLSPHLSLRLLQL